MKSNPSSTPKARLRLTLAGRYWLIASAAFAAIGIYKGINLILLLAYFLVVLFVLNWASVWRSLNKLHARLDPLDDGFVGETRRCRCHLELVGRKRTRGLQVSIQLAQQICNWYVPLVTRAQPIQLTRMIILPKRGVYPTGIITLKNSFPFGLVEAVAESRDDRTFAIYPQRGEIDLGRMLRRLGRDATDRGMYRTAVRQLTEGTDIHGLRPFRPGDSPRWIHWRTTARIGELMVREFDRASGPSLTAVVMPQSKEAEFERSLQFTSAMVWEWSRRQEGRLRLWISLARNWESWELDHRRRAEDLLRRLAAATFDASPPTVSPAELPTRGPIVYISSTPAPQATDTNCEWIDPSQTGHIYKPPILTP